MRTIIIILSSWYVGMRLQKKIAGWFVFLYWQGTEFSEACTHEGCKNMGKEIVDIKEYDELLEHFSDDNDVFLSF